MQHDVYKLVELTGTSTTSIEEAVNTAIKRASGSLRNLRWFHIVEIRGNITDDKVDHWQVTLKAGFGVE